MTAAELFVKCLENENVEYIFGIPGEENVDVMDALLDSSIKFVTTHHEQGAAFMADVYGRLTGRVGVCMSTLGPGATTRLHKESHQILDLVSMFQPITKYSTQILDPGIIPEIVRKAFKVAQTEKPGASFVDFPENVAGMQVDKRPIKVQRAYTSEAPQRKVDQATQLISAAKARSSWQAMASSARAPPMHERADVVIWVGYDMAEYHPDMWNPNGDKTIIHIDALPAEIDERYVVAVGVLGDLQTSLRSIALDAKPWTASPFKAVRRAIVEDRAEFSRDTAFPIKPQKTVWDLREAMGPDDIAISDVGAHKMLMSRMYKAERANTCIISNGFAAMGIALPGAVAAKIAYPDRKVVTVTGDAGFMMNPQEIETALRMKTPFVVLIWNDSEYGPITRHQLRHFGRPSHIEFKNPDFVRYAESFGAKGYRVERAQDLAPTLKRAFEDNTVVIIDCPVDYAENMKLTARQKEMKSPL